MRRIGIDGLVKPCALVITSQSLKWGFLVVKRGKQEFGSGSIGWGAYFRYRRGLYDITREKNIILELQCLELVFFFTLALEKPILGPLLSERKNFVTCLAAHLLSLTMASRGKQGENKYQ